MIFLHQKQLFLLMLFIFSADPNYADYTKTSYLKKISDNATGKVVIFNRGGRTDYEDGWSGYEGLYDDPQNNKSDNYEEFYSTQNLESIKFYDKDPDIYPKFPTSKNAISYSTCTE